MPDEKITFENMDITDSEDILDAAEIAEAETDAPDDTPGADPAGTVAEEPEAETEGQEVETPDELVSVLESLTAQISGAASRLDELAGRIAALETINAERSKKLTGFFKPIDNGNDDSRDSGSDPFPRIERKYI